MRNGLIPGGFSTKTGKHAVLFTVVIPMDDEQGLWETFCDLSKARIGPYKNTWKPLQDCNLTKQGPMPSSSVTLLAEFIEKAVCTKTKEQLYQRESARPRVVLRANSQCESQDPPSQEARSSWKTQSDAQSFQETECNIVDYRVPGISRSTVQQQDEQRQHVVAKLIEKFESHKYKEEFLQDMSQTQKINRFSEESQKMRKDMNQTEIFELCEISTKLQYSDCNSLTEIGINYCSCGRSLKCKRSPTKFQQDNYDFNSIPGYIIKKNSSRGPKHGQSERQIMFFKAKDMQRKAKNKKNENQPTNLSR